MMEGDDGRGWKLTEGKVGGNGFTFGGIGVPPAVNREQEARGVKWCSWRACEGGREGAGGRKGWAASVAPFIPARGGWGRVDGRRHTAARSGGGP
jgi:hypothetical protein